MNCFRPLPLPPHLQEHVEQQQQQQVQQQLVVEQQEEEEEVLQPHQTLLVQTEGGILVPGQQVHLVEGEQLQALQEGQQVQLVEQVTVAAASEGGEGRAAHHSKNQTTVIAVVPF